VGDGVMIYDSLAKSVGPDDIPSLLTDQRLQRILHRIEDQALNGRLKPRSYSMIIFSLGRLGYRPPETFLDALRVAGEDGLLFSPDCDALCLSNILHGFVR